MDAKYTFVKVSDRKLNGFDKNEVQELLLKWSMKERLKIQTYCFNEEFHSYDSRQFVMDFFKDPTVTTTLENVDYNNVWTPVGIAAGDVKIEQIPCTITSMEFFDRLQENRQVADKRGHINKCLGEPIENFEIWDELRKMLLDEESENRELFSKSEKNEFIYHLLNHLCLGGQLCQYEDTLPPYLKVTKLLYKDLVSVAKDQDTKKIVTTSVVYKVVAKDKNGRSYFPADAEHLQNFCYLIVDPMKRAVKCVIHQFGSSF